MLPVMRRGKSGNLRDPKSPKVGISVEIFTIVKSSRRIFKVEAGNFLQFLAILVF
jgi:hypothetical protein